MDPSGARAARATVPDQGEGDERGADAEARPAEWRGNEGREGVEPEGETEAETRRRQHDHEPGGRDRSGEGDRGIPRGLCEISQGCRVLPQRRSERRPRLRRDRPRGGEPDARRAAPGVPPAAEALARRARRPLPRDELPRGCWRQRRGEQHAAARPWRAATRSPTAGLSRRSRHFVASAPRPHAATTSRSPSSASRPRRASRRTPDPGPSPHVRRAAPPRSRSRPGGRRWSATCRRARRAPRVARAHRRASSRAACRRHRRGRC